MSRRDVDGGADPLASRVAKRQAPTLNDLCDRYISDWLPRKRDLSAADDKTMIEKIIRPRLGAEKLSSVSHRDVDQLHQSLRATPYRANRVLSLLSKMFNLSIRWEWRSDNPAVGSSGFLKTSANAIYPVRRSRA